MSNGYLISIDPSDFSRFPAEEPDDEEELEGGPDEMQLTEEEIAFIKSQDLQRVEPLLDRIPEREADALHMYFYLDKRQADIAAIFEITQAAVSYRLARGIRRIKFLFEIPAITEEQLRLDLPDAFPDPIDVDILAGMLNTTCQTAVASQLGLTQGRVRHRFFSAVAKLKEVAEADPERYGPYRDLFGKISMRKFNILREVKLPQWADRGGDVLG